MDEIPVWFDMVGNFTVSQKGEKTVQIRSTDNKKTRLTVVLMCHSLTDGSFLRSVSLKGSDYQKAKKISSRVIVWF
ncbi:uncharacterized protein OCT59_027837 [Rhizophagus irregularis]|uniref:uncharacterized protein n=1 Tax=Rhizophagus irregularis TaxID=588596 RepID=UPI000CC0CF47|nr:hypothetical protein OCT59_027837 [Rhizophagus irregularis]